MSTHPSRSKAFKRLLSAALLVTGLSTACTWVKTTPEAEQVRIVPADRVADCKRIGDLSTYTKPEIAGVKRSAAKIREELEALARNEAAEMNADTIISTSEVVDGRMGFLAYRCRQ